MRVKGRMLQRAILSGTLGIALGAGGLPAAEPFPTQMMQGAVAEGNSSQWVRPLEPGRPLVAREVQLGEPEQPSFFRRTYDSMSNGMSSMGRGVKSMFKKKPEQSPTEPSKADPTSLAHKAKPADADFYVTLARMQEQTGNWAGAEKQYQKALDDNPRHLQALLGYAHVMEQMGSSERALELYQKAVKAHPDSAAAHNDLALCYSQSGRHTDAIASFHKAISIDPKRKLYRNNLATVLIRIGRPQEAYEHLSQVHTPAVAHYNVGYLLNQAGHPEEALVQFQMAIEAQPNFTEAQQWHSVLAARLLPEMPTEQSDEVPAGMAEPAPQIAARPVDLPAGRRVPTETPREATPPGQVAPQARMPMPPQAVPAAPLPAGAPRTPVGGLEQPPLPPDGVMAGPPRAAQMMPATASPPVEMSDEAPAEEAPATAVAEDDSLGEPPLPEAPIPAGSRVPKLPAKSAAPAESKKPERYFPPSRF